MRATALPSTRTATGDSSTVRLRLLIGLNAMVGSPMPHNPQRTYLIAFWSRSKQSSQICEGAPNGSDQSLNSRIVGKPYLTGLCQGCPFLSGVPQSRLGRVSKDGCFESDDLMSWHVRPGLCRDVVPLDHESF